MEWAIGLFVLVTIISVIVRLGKRSPQSTELALSYQCKKSLLTPAEQVFLKALDSVIDKRFRVFSMVRVADVIEADASLSASDKHKLFRKISQKHFDFVLCDPSNLEPICAIELNDKSHQKKKRKERDEFLTQACKSAGISLHFVKVQRSYDLSQLAELLGGFETPILKKAS